MKKYLLWIVALGGLALAGWYYVKKGSAAAATPATSPAATNTGTATAANGWWPGLTGLVNNTLKTGNLNSQDAMNELASISNAFGLNDGGASGVSVGGSSAGGTQSSGSGAGVATVDGATNTLFDYDDTLTADNSNPAGDASSYDDSEDF
jgi:hypothetical protein